ncbi:hypothetical protein CIPAW_06G077900 [Carya illinoinensis]|uniref:Uncharacterized protein n=1 Tax=Carya illinoinensis TaxID=32201 RepID=A0A8T1Q909_CARIL|nr:hypothetical protein CIPAW_06G077900 [Carya illinoinensis]
MEFLYLPLNDNFIKESTESSPYPNIAVLQNKYTMLLPLLPSKNIQENRPLVASVSSPMSFLRKTIKQQHKLQQKNHVDDDPHLKQQNSSLLKTHLQ